MAGKGDLRRTITPEGAEIILGANGYSVCVSNETIFEVDWAKVRQISAFTRFMDGEYRLCLMFALSRRSSDAVVINEGVRGWQSLVKTMMELFLSADRDWVSKAAYDASMADADRAITKTVPAFTINPTIVWTAT